MCRWACPVCNRKRRAAGLSTLLTFSDWATPTPNRPQPDKQKKRSSMARFTAPSGEIYFEYRGARANPRVLFVHGLACQLVQWPDSLIDGIVDAGYCAAIFDNRDVGLSDGPDQPAALPRGPRGARRPVGIDAGLHTLRHGGRRCCASQPLGTRRRTRHRPVHGGHDQPAAGHRTSGTGLQPDLHHVVDGQSGTPRSRRRGDRRPDQHCWPGGHGHDHRAEHPGRGKSSAARTTTPRSMALPDSRDAPWNARTGPKASCASLPQS